jgi:hypothetical protein
MTTLRHQMREMSEGYRFKKRMSGVEAKFRSLAERYYEDTFFMSSCPEYTHPLMREIIKMGKPALPYIFNEMKDGARGWWYAVREITGSRPLTITNDDAGKVKVLNEKYLQWGKEQGYVGELTREAINSRPPIVRIEQ